MTVPLPGRAASRLNIGDALHDGWQAFCRNPGSFVLFAMLLWGLQTGFQLLQSRLGVNGVVSTSPLDWLLALVGLVGAFASYFWGRIGIVRAALKSLDGHRPRFIEMVRWDGEPIGRLFGASLLLGALLVAGALAIALAVVLPLVFLVASDQARGAGGAAVPDLAYIALVILLVLLVGLLLVAAIYLNVNQQFQSQISLTEQLGPWATLRRGRVLADPHWPLLLLLVIIEGLLCILGALACFVGFFVAWPVALCITTAAYRQLLALEATRRPASGASPAA